MIAGVKVENGSCDPHHAPFKGDLSFLCWDLIQPTCVQNLVTIFIHTGDMIGTHQNLNGSHDLTMPLLGMVCHSWASTCYDQPD